MSWVREPGSEPIPGYRLLEPLGSGGFGEVWKCEAPGGVHKACKIVYGNLNSLDVDAVRAEQERKALKRIIEVKHPFICKVDRIDELNGELIIVMDLAESTLHDKFQECQAAGLIGIPHDELLRYMRDAAEALDYMFEKHDLQHLDVKPRNLFLQGDRLLVADFGLVKPLNKENSGYLGSVTPLYASPETFNGKISRHSDQYSLAIVYQEMLTGHRPFAGKNIRILAQQHLQEEPDMRALPAGERPVVARALAKAPEKRWPTCMEFIKALYGACGAVRVSVRKQEPALVGAGARPKTLADTLEDFALDELAEPPAADDAVDLAGPRDPDNQGSDQQLLGVSDMGITVAHPDSGALRPTLFIGVGGFGRRALLELRCRFVDRFGDLGKVPLLRFLCIDVDPDGVNQAVRGAPEVALSRSEVLHLPLQPVSNYRRRMIEQLSDWLPREKLYSMPRSLQPQGSRALGRLAFVDNYQKVFSRLRRELQEATAAEAIYASVAQTGLAVRDSQPRVYIVASAGGGSSGMLADLGYTLKRQLAFLRQPEAQIVLFLLCSAPSDPASPKSELANVQATLTEINHYCDPSNGFSAQYGVEGQRLVDQGSPFAAVYLLPLPHRGPAALEDVLAHLGSYVFHEATTPLGGRLERRRQGGGTQAEPTNSFNAPFRSLGTFGVWFPRGLLLRLAARLACRKLIETWLTTDETNLSSGATPEQIEATCEAIINDPKFATDTLLARIEEATRATHVTELGATPAEAVTGLLANLHEQSLQTVAQDDPGNWSRQALNRIREWLGGDECQIQYPEWRKTRVNRSLQLAATKVAEECARNWVGGLVGVMEFPGARLSAAEQALALLEEYGKSQIAAHHERLVQQQAKTKQAWAQLDVALTECQTGGSGLRWFGNRSSRRQLSNFVEKLSVYVRQRIQEEHVAALGHFFVALQGQLNEQGRDLGFCRQRLRHLQENLEVTPGTAEEDLAATRPGADYTVTHTPVPSTQAYWEAIRQSHTARVVLPEGEQELDRAAIKLLQRLTEADWTQLDKDLQQRVLQPIGGLHRACLNSGDLTHALAAPLIDEMINLLGNHLPVMDVAQILGKEFGCSFDAQNSLDETPGPPELATQTLAYLDRAAPLVGQAEDGRRHSFLLMPASAAGRALSKALEEAMPDLKYVPVPGQADLMICCDQGPLTIRDLTQLLKLCSQAYQQLATVPQSSPHARFDLLDWMPINP
jgi:serine/threonine protein kinase